MAEWSMALACYARLGLYRGRGSNPLFSGSAVITRLFRLVGQDGTLSRYQRGFESRKRYQRFRA